MLLLGGRRRTALSLDDIRRVTRFILHYAELHSLVLPGRVPGFKRDDVKVFSTCNNHRIFRLIQRWCNLSLILSIVLFCILYICCLYNRQHNILTIASSHNRALYKTIHIHNCKKRKRINNNMYIIIVVIIN